jgi:nitroreductase
MDTIEAIETRFSARAFKPSPVPKETLAKIFEAAIRTPSWADSQPWEVFLAGGEILNTMRAANLERARSGAPRALEMPAPQKWPETIQHRITENMSARLKFIGINQDDKEAMRKVTENNYLFFNAPVVAFLCMDRTLTSWSAFDTGAFSQSIMLAARNYNVDSIPAVMMVSYPDIIRKALDIPPELSILFAIALGYNDEENPVNRFRSARRKVEEVVRYYGI